MEGLGLPHLLLIAIIFLVFFGPSRLPQLGQSLGKAIRGFKSGLNEIEVEAKDVKDQVAQTKEQAQLHQQNQAASQAQTEKTETQRKS